MPLHLTNIGKKYHKNWVFRNVDFQFSTPGSYVIKGSNGSGKSTLLKILSGHLSASEGEQKLIIDSSEIPLEHWPEHIAYAAPYFQLIENMDLEEFLKFYTQFKPLKKDITIDKLITSAYLESSRNKQIKNFSSGMKQRLKLALSILSDSSFILLDEPSTNLDKQSTDWFLKTLERYRGDRLVIIASNVEDDLRLCNEEISVERYK